jgi:hypothetical protein
MYTKTLNSDMKIVEGISDSLLNQSVNDKEEKLYKSKNKCKKSLNNNI